VTASFLGGLLRLSRRGDEAAFRRLVESTRERLFWTVRRMVGRDAVSEEILQEGYLALWALPRGKTPDEPMAWLRRFCVNRAIDHLRREETRRTSDASDVIETLPGNADPESGLRAGEMEEGLREALSVLPPQERAAFVLRFIEELDYRDIAEAMGVTESTVRNQVMQARRKAEGVLRARGIEP
jgi:RNA polymerase sigma-70 factor (ECF subfamily)